MVPRTCHSGEKVLAKDHALSRVVTGSNSYISFEVNVLTYDSFRRYNKPIFAETERQ